MKKLILSAIVAIAAGTAATAQAEAASFTITTGDSGQVYDRYDGPYDNGPYRRWYNDRRPGWRYGMDWRQRPAYRDCEVTTTRHWRHGRLIIERTRDCY